MHDAPFMLIAEATVLLRVVIRRVCSAPHASKIVIASPRNPSTPSNTSRHRRRPRAAFSKPVAFVADEERGAVRPSQLAS